MLKKLLLLTAFVAVFIGCSNFSFAAYNQSITTNPISLINDDVFNVRYEQIMGADNSIWGDLSYQDSWKHVTYLTLEAGYRWYFRKIIPEIRTTALEGFSVGPFANLNYYNLSDGDLSDSWVGFGIGAEAAYKFVFWGGFAVEPSIKLNIGFRKKGYNDGFSVNPCISIGYAW